MALIDIEKQFSFLKDVELKELKNKNQDYISKTIKFNKEERILLQYITYIDKSFSSYIKQLIEKDIETNLGNKKIIKGDLDESYLISLIENVLDKKNKSQNNDIEEIQKNIISKGNKDLLGDLEALNIRKR